jgi:hypothetical protein
MMYSLTILSNKNPPRHPSQPKKNPKKRNQNLDLSIVDHAIYKELHRKEKEKIKEKRKPALENYILPLNNQQTRRPFQNPLKPKSLGQNSLHKISL